MEEGTFIKVYDWIIQDNTASEALCYALLLSFCKDGSKYSGGMGYLSRRLNMSRKTVKRVLAKLIEKDLVKQDTIIKNNVEYNVYWLADGDKTTRRQIDPTPVDILTPPYGHSDPTPVDILTPNNINNKDNNKENNKEYKHITPSDEGVTFEQFWDAYDYKKSKKDAERAWKKLSKADKDAAMKAIPAYHQDCVRCNRHRQYAATYLRKRTFEDDFSFNDNKPNNNERDNIRRGAWPTPTENATRAEEWATNRILELTQPKDKGIQGEIPDNRDTDKLFLPF